MYEIGSISVASQRLNVVTASGANSAVRAKKVLTVQSAFKN